MCRNVAVVSIVLMMTVVVATTVMAEEEFAYQQGVEGYSGCEDVTIAAGGWSVPPISQLRVRAKYPSSDEIYNTLIRFDGLSDALDGWSATSVTLSLTFQQENQGYAPATIDIYSCLKGWSGPSWEQAIPPDIDWEVPGAQGAEDRFICVPDYFMGDRSYGDQYPDEQVFEIFLPVSLIQSWIDDPSSNYGIIVAMDSVARTDVTFSSSEDSEPSFRPLLTITAEESVEVPDVVGMEQLAAVIAIANSDLNIGEITDGYSDTITVGCVMEQNPVAGAFVPADTAVALVISVGPSPDFDGSGVVDLEDFAVLASEWDSCDNVTTDLTGDGCVNMEDLVAFMEWWLGTP